MKIERFYISGLSIYQFCSIVILHLNGLSLIHIKDSPYQFPSVDMTFWLIHGLGLIELNKSAYFSYVLEFLFFLLPIVFYFKSSRILTWINILVLILYEILYNSNALHHFHHLLPLAIGWLALTTNDKKKRMMLMNFFVFYVLFIFWSAGLWKILRGYIFQPNQFENMLWAQNAASLYLEPRSLKSIVQFYMINHAKLAQIVYFVGILFQVFVLSAYFTKKWDNLLIIGLVIFSILDYFLMSIISLLPILGVFVLVLRKKFNYSI
ncbi:MAG: hypothetical protein MUE53_06315 [Chitinophagales bacterium]|jgi:hypothetical protein|nr:hypothetical protein [Chitinophagales bacterium]